MRRKLTDKQLVEKTLEGNVNAFGILVNRYRGLVHGLTFHIISNFQDAEDIAQEAFIKAYESLSTLKDKAKFGSWLRIITLNLCKMWLRRSLLELPLPSEFDLVKEDISPSDELQEIVFSALSALPSKNQVVIALFYLDDLSYKEIGDFLGLPVSTVQSRLQRARQQLKEEVLKMAEDIFQNNRLGSKFTQKVLDEIMVKGREYIGAKEWNEAESTFLKAIEMKPDHVEAYFQLGIVKESQRLYEDAVKWYQKTVELNPYHAKAYLNLATSFFYLNKYNDAVTEYDKAISAYQKLIDLNPKDPELYNYLGETYASKGDTYGYIDSITERQELSLYRKAIECYRKAVELKSDYIQAYRNLAFAGNGLYKTEEAHIAYEESIAGYKKLLQLSPDDPKLYKDIGEIYTDKGDLDNGIITLKRAIELKPDYFEAYAYLGHAYQSKGNLEDAKRMYKQTTEIEIDPKRFDSNPEAYRIMMAYNNLGGIYMDERDYDQGVFYMQKAVEKEEELGFRNKLYQRNLAVCHTVRGSALADKGEYLETVASYKKAIKIFDELQQNRYMRQHLEKERHPNIIKAFESFVSQNPEDAEAYYCLACIYSVNGDADKALKFISKAIELDPNYSEKAKTSSFFN